MWLLLEDTDLQSGNATRYLVLNPTFLLRRALVGELSVFPSHFRMIYTDVTCLQRAKSCTQVY